MTMTRALVTASLAFLCLVACSEGRHAAIGPERQEAVAIERGDAERANVELDLGAGELAVDGGAKKLVEGSFTYNVPEWKPIVKTSLNGASATVTIKQPENIHAGGNTRYRWDLALNDQVLMDLTLNCGAGEARLNLGELQLRSLDVHIGVGKVDLNLEGEPKRDYEVNISGGVGEATVRLPKNAGIWAQAHGGIGSIDVSGLEKHGDHYENSLYDHAKANIRLQVNGGIGEIRIIG